MLREISEIEFDTVKQTEAMLLVFYSKYCGPCKMLRHVLQDLEGVLPNFPMYLIDFNENSALKEALGVQGFPSLLFYKEGDEVKRMEGLQQKHVLLQAIHSLSSSY